MKTTYETHKRLDNLQSFKGNLQFGGPSPTKGPSLFLVLFIPLLDTILEVLRLPE